MPNATQNKSIFGEIEKWAGAELNRRHEDFQSSALPTELPAHIKESNHLRDRFSRLPVMYAPCGKVAVGFL